MSETRSVLEAMSFNTCMEWIMSRAVIQNQCRAILGNLKVIDLKCQCCYPWILETVVVAFDAFVVRP